MAPAGLVTHRIVSIKPGPAGGRVFRTKGDANAVADPWTFSLGARTQAKAAFHLPYVGFAFAALEDRRVRMLLIGVLLCSSLPRPSPEAGGAVGRGGRQGTGQ